MAGRVFVFDLDDTLIDNVHDYAEPILDTCRLIVKTFGRKAPHVDVIIALEHEIDSRRVKETNPDTGQPFLYSMERFPGSMVEVYREIAKRVGVIPDSELEKDFYAIGMRAFDKSRYARNVHPAAKRVLDYLTNKGDKIALLTKGDATVQRKKIAVLKNAGISNFSAVWVVGQKLSISFSLMARDFLPSSARLTLYSVGNSYESDIKPALTAGFKGILVPVETWDLIGKMDDVVREAKENGVFVFRDLSDIITHYEEL
ncbi:MAG: hypothetical protein AAB930_04030 [Patescibacteria group bacterium]